MTADGLEHLQPLYNDLHEAVAGRLAALVEGFSSLTEFEYEQTPFPSKSSPPVGGAVLSNVRPTVHLSLTWEAENKSAVYNDLESIQSQLSAFEANITIDGDAAPERDPAEGNARLTEYGNREDTDTVTAEATLKVPVFTRSYSHAEDWLHGEQQMRDGPNYNVTDKWNCRGVRCLLVERYVPVPAEWGESDPIDYWTGYVYLGGPEEATETEARWSHYNLPERIGDPGMALPNVSYPDHSNQHASGGEPDNSGWIGWDNNFEPDKAPEAGPEEAHMTEEEAREATELLAKGVREVWDRKGVTPAEVYAGDVSGEAKENPNFMEA